MNIILSTCSGQNVKSSIAFSAQIELYGWGLYLLRVYLITPVFRTHRHTMNAQNIYYSSLRTNKTDKMNVSCFRLLFLETHFPILYTRMIHGPVLQEIEQLYVSYVYKTETENSIKLLP